MTLDLVTIVTPTLGDSCGHLNRQMIDLRQFTKLPFRQLVSDDGTIDESQKARQREVCRVNGADWTENPGPTWGISYNFNHALSQVKTPWAFCVEDGLRPGYGWLETAVDAIRQYGERTWQGHSVGMMGTAHFNDWHLALGGVLPTHLTVMDFLHRTTAECYSAFWGGAHWPNWNDGFWCWDRLLPRWRQRCSRDDVDSWPRTPAPWNFIHLIRYGCLPGGEVNHGNLLPTCGIAIDADHERLDRTRQFGSADNWPRRRIGQLAWFPGAFMLVNMEAWRAVGRFTDGCPFFEGSLGARMALAGYLSLYLDFPPWMHYGGMGFINAERDAKKPRDHRPTDGDGAEDCLKREFGVNGPSHVDLYSLMMKGFPQEKLDLINKELATVRLHAEPEWEVWS